MGCMNTKQDTPSIRADNTKAESNDFGRPKLDPKDFIVSKRKGEVIVKKPGSIKGQQFVIEECEDCKIYLFDHSDSISVDYCTNCEIFAGPISGSFFIRDCKDSKVVVACQQFRTRDCKNLDILLYASTRPIIEKSKDMRFGCFQYYYPELLNQFSAAKQSVFVNDWSNIYDFTQDPTNWSYLPPEAIENFLTPAPESSEEHKGKSVVPYTHGNRPKPYPEIRFLLFYPNKTEQAIEISNALRSEKRCCLIIQTKETKLNEKAINEIFTDPKIQQKVSEAAKQGNFIGLEVNGNIEDLEYLSKWCGDDAYCSMDHSNGSQQSNTFFNLLAAPIS